MKKSQNRRKNQSSLAFGNKKGNAVSDTLLVVVVLFIFSIMAVVSYNIYHDLNTQLQADDTISNTTKETLQDLDDSYPDMFDQAIGIALVLFWIFALGSSLFIDTHPLFFIVSLVLLVSILFVAGVMANTYEELVQDTDLGTGYTEFPITNWIFSHYVELGIIIMFTIGIALYGKSRGGL